MKQIVPEIETETGGESARGRLATRGGKRGRERPR